MLSITFSYFHYKNLVATSPPQLMKGLSSYFQGMSPKGWVNMIIGPFYCILKTKPFHGCSKRCIMNIYKGTLGVEPRTCRTAAGCSTTELYPRTCTGVSGLSYLLSSLERQETSQVQKYCCQEWDLNPCPLSRTRNLMHTPYQGAKIEPWVWRLRPLGHPDIDGILWTDKSLWDVCACSKSFSSHLGIEPRTFGLEVQRAILCANGTWLWCFHMVY